MESKTTNINLTNNASIISDHGMKSLLWISTLVINFFVIAISFWIVLAVLVYVCKPGKFNRRKEVDYSGGIIMKLLFAATVLVLPRFAITNVITWIGFDLGLRGDLVCEIFLDISTVTYYVALLPTYFFLWARQRSVYKKPPISRLYNLFVKLLSWGSVLIWNLTAIGIIVLFILPLAYMSSPNGCVLREKEKVKHILLYLLPVILVSGQLLLLGLFIYPLYHHTHIQVSSSTKNEEHKKRPSAQTISNHVDSRAVFTTEDNTKKRSPRIYNLSNQSSRHKRRFFVTKNLRMDSSNQPKELNFSFPSTKIKRESTLKTKPRITAVIRRSVICAIVCIVSDLVATIGVDALIPLETPRSFTNLCYDLSLLINIIALIFSFESYKSIFKAPCKILCSKNASLNISKAASSTRNDKSK